MSILSKELPPTGGFTRTKKIVFIQKKNKYRANKCDDNFFSISRSCWLQKT